MHRQFLYNHNILMLLFFLFEIYNLLFAMQDPVGDSNTHYFNNKIELKLKNKDCMDQIELKNRNQIVY